LAQSLKAQVRSSVNLMMDWVAQLIKRVPTLYRFSVRALGAIHRFATVAQRYFFLESTEPDPEFPDAEQISRLDIPPKACWIAEHRPSIDIVIPVYRRPDLVRDLVDSLEVCSDLQYLETIWLVDDRGDGFTSEYLDRIANDRPQKYKIIRNDKNLGFLGTCNKAFKESRAEFVMLVNTDVRVPNGFIERMIEPFRNKSVALATPLATSGANLSVDLRPGQTWQDVDDLLRSNPPQYPDACTAVGYMLAIRRSAVDGDRLFDPIFEHGYCEDTDLHYRVLAAGLRSVVVDNLIVYHQGSASYALDSKKAAIYDLNRRIFFERWREVHEAALFDYDPSKSLGHILNIGKKMLHESIPHTRKELVGRHLDILFLSPTNNVALGGVKVIFELVVHLRSKGLQVGILCHDRVGVVDMRLETMVRPFYSEDHLHSVVSSVGTVVGTGLGTLKSLNTETLYYQQAKRWWFLQGPEASFGFGSDYFRFKDVLRTCDLVIVVSKFLFDLSRDWGVERVQQISLGPDSLKFYPREVTRRRNAIATQLIDNPDKGSRYAIHLLEAARQDGWEVHMFGSGLLMDAVPNDFGVKLGKLDSDGLAKLFSTVTYYLDLSVMEGLGLLPLEAVSCGAKPIMTRKGAPDFIFDGETVLWLQSHFDTGGFLNVLSMASGPVSPEKSNSIRNLYASRKAYDEFLRILTSAT
jgi:GT2 family glycosyltransferase